MPKHSADPEGHALDSTINFLKKHLTDKWAESELIDLSEEVITEVYGYDPDEDEDGELYEITERQFYEKFMVTALLALAVDVLAKGYMPEPD